MGSPAPPSASRLCRKLFRHKSPTNLFQRLPRGGHTRSLSEHGSQAPHRRWYLAHGPGRVGRRWILEAPCPIGRGPLRFWRPFRLRLHSRDHARSIPGTCRSRPPKQQLEGPFLFMCPSPRWQGASSFLRTVPPPAPLSPSRPQRGKPRWGLFLSRGIQALKGAALGRGGGGRPGSGRGCSQGGFFPLFFVQIGMFLAGTLINCPSKIHACLILH